MKSYGITKQNAIDFANRKNQEVYIAKAKRLNKYCIYFDKSEKTPNYDIIETVQPDFKD